MSLKSIVKVSHLSNLSDARFCSGMGVELLGFAAVPESQYYMSPTVFQEIRGWVAGPKIIAEIYGLTSPDQISEIVKAYAPDYLEMAWDEYTRYKDALTFPCIVEVGDNASIGLAAHEEKIAYIIADEESTCNDVVGVNVPVLVRVESTEHLERKMKAGCFQGYVLDGPIQTKAGITSYDELGDILEALEED